MEMLPGLQLMELFARSELFNRSGQASGASSSAPCTPLKSKVRIFVCVEHQDVGCGSVQSARFTFKMPQNCGQSWTQCLLFEVYLLSEHPTVTGRAAILWFRQILNVTTPFGEHDPPHPLPPMDGHMGGGLDVTTPFGEHDPPPSMDKRQGGGLRSAVALALLLVYSFCHIVACTHRVALQKQWCDKTRFLSHSNAVARCPSSSFSICLETLRKRELGWMVSHFCFHIKGN